MYLAHQGISRKISVPKRPELRQELIVRDRSKSSRLRLDAASGISAISGDVAEWLKAAVC
jgi:hypothetical protein